MGKQPTKLTGKTPSERLIAARRAARFDQRKQAAKRFGWNYSTYSTHESGTTPISLEHAELYAKAFRIPGGAAWLLTGVGEAPAVTAPIVGYIGDNAEAHYFESDEDGGDPVPIPAEFPAGTVALEVRGDGLFPVNDGWLILYDGTVTTVSTEAVNRFSVVRLADGRQFVRKMVPASSPSRFHLLTIAATPLFDQEVTSAAMVLLMRPRKLSKLDK